MNPDVIAVLALCISSVSAAASAAAIWWHCKADHERAGMMWERSVSDRMRLDELERHEDAR